MLAKYGEPIKQNLSKIKTEQKRYHELNVGYNGEGMGALSENQIDQRCQHYYQ